VKPSLQPRTCWGGRPGRSLRSERPRASERWRWSASETRPPAAQAAWRAYRERPPERETAGERAVEVERKRETQPPAAQAVRRGLQGDNPSPKRKLAARGGAVAQTVTDEAERAYGMKPSWSQRSQLKQQAKRPREGSNIGAGAVPIAHCGNDRLRQTSEFRGGHGGRAKRSTRRQPRGTRPKEGSATALARGLAKEGRARRVRRV